MNLFFYLNVLPRTVVKTSVKLEVLLKTCKSCLITEKGTTVLKTHRNAAEYLTAICPLWIYCYCSSNINHYCIKYLAQNNHFKTQKEWESTSNETAGTINKWQVKNMTVWQGAAPDLTSGKPFPSRGDKLHIRQHTTSWGCSTPTHRTLGHLLLQGISGVIIAKMTRSKVFLH